MPRGAYMQYRHSQKTPCHAPCTVARAITIASTTRRQITRMAATNATTAALGEQRDPEQDRVIFFYLVIFPVFWLTPLVCLGCFHFLLQRPGSGDATQALSPEAQSVFTTVVTAEKKSKALRLRVNATLGALGWAIAILTLGPYAQCVFGKICMNTAAGNFQYYTPSCEFGWAFMFLAIRPIDNWLILFFCYLNEAYLLFMSVMMTIATVARFRAAQNIEFMNVYGASGVLVFCAAFSSLVYLVPALNVPGTKCGGASMPPRQQLLRLWETHFLINAWGIIYHPVLWVPPWLFGYPARDGFGFNPVAANFVGWCTCIVWCLLYRYRARLIPFLSSIGSSGNTEQEAASVASVLGKASAAQALADATNYFRAQPLNTLSREDLQNNKPDPNLHQKTIPATLGHVHAFVSHSWSDDGNVKFDKLQEWAQEMGGGDLLIWLDKACIDQLNIDRSLSSLPVFLAGCKQLFIIAGPTYMTRLWQVFPRFRSEARISRAASHADGAFALNEPAAQVRDGDLRVCAHGWDNGRHGHQDHRGLRHRDPSHQLRREQGTMLPEYRPATAACGDRVELRHAGPVQQARARHHGREAPRQEGRDPESADITRAGGLGASCGQGGQRLNRLGARRRRAETLLVVGVAQWIASESFFLVLVCSRSSSVVER